MKPASQHPAVTGNRALASRMAKNPADPKPSRGGRGDYDLDDEVFFRGADGPRSGRVVSHGQHGCTVDEPCGKRHHVLWESVLGLKGRKTYPAKVVDRGSAGSILERADGSRFYVAGEVPLAEEPDDLSADEVLQKADELARLGERIALLAVAPARSIPAGLPLLWGLHVP